MISFVAGSDKDILINITDYLPWVTDITGCSFKWELDVRDNPIIKDSSSGGIFVDVPNGQVTIKLTHQETEGLFGIYEHELQLTDANGNITVVFSEPMEIYRGMF